MGTQRGNDIEILILEEGKTLFPVSAQAPRRLSPGTDGGAIRAETGCAGCMR